MQHDVTKCHVPENAANIKQEQNKKCWGVCFLFIQFLSCRNSSSIISSFFVYCFFFKYILNRSTAHLPLYLQTASYLTTRQCKSLRFLPDFESKQTDSQESRVACYLSSHNVCVAVTPFSTLWMRPARCVRSRARDRWPTWTKASFTPWRSASSAPTSACVTPSVKSGWAPVLVSLYPHFILFFVHFLAQPYL